MKYLSRAFIIAAYINYMLAALLAPDEARRTLIDLAAAVIDPEIKHTLETEISKDEK